MRRRETSSQSHSFTSLETSTLRVYAQYLVTLVRDSSRHSATVGIVGGKQPEERRTQGLPNPELLRSTTPWGREPRMPGRSARTFHTGSHLLFPSKAHGAIGISWLPPYGGLCSCSQTVTILTPTRPPWCWRDPWSTAVCGQFWALRRRATGRGGAAPPDYRVCRQSSIGRAQRAVVHYRGGGSVGGLLLRESRIWGVACGAPRRPRRGRGTA